MAEAGHGTVLALPFTPLPRVDARAGTRAWVVGALLLLLPMLFQCFQYVIDVPPLYLLAKMWPILMLPFALYGLFFLRLPHTVLYVLLLAYALGVTPFLSMVQLPNNFAEALVSTNRVWPLFLYFAAATLLHLLRPTPDHIRRALLILAIATFALFWVLWLVMPADAYRSDPAESQVFYLENERGYRIVLPIGFAMIGLFYVARRFCEASGVWRLVLLVAGLGTLLVIYKQRTSIATATLLILYTLSSRLPRRLRMAGIGAAAFAVAAGVALQSAGLTAALGGSLSVRQHSAGLAYDYLRDDPLRWLFGVGSTTSFSRTTLQDILGFDFFFLTDLGWLGVVFEYGLVGAALIACFDLTGWQQAAKAGRVGQAWNRAVADYALYLLLVSAVYSVVYAPGDMATITALAWYTLRQAPANQALLAAR